MGIAYQSHQIASWVTTASSVVVTKPTGLAVGDLMIAQVSLRDTAGGRTIDLVSGWTDSGANEVTETISGSDHIAQRVMRKIATSDDVAASNFTFTISGGTTAYLCASIYRIDGFNAATPIDKYSSGHNNGTATGSSGGSVTPTYANELYLILTTVRTSGASATMSGYTLATSNPSWTEDYDSNSALGQPSMSGAHATRVEVTGTGAATFTIDSGSNSVAIGFLIVIKDKIDAQTTLEEAVVNLSAPNPTITGGATLTLEKSVLNLNALAINASQALWSSQQKSSSGTWTAQTKS